MYHKRWALAGAAATALSVLAGLAMAAPAAAAAAATVAACTGCGPRCPSARVPNRWTVTSGACRARACA